MPAHISLIHSNSSDGNPVLLLKEAPGKTSPQNMSATQKIFILSLKIKYGIYEAFTSFEFDRTRLDGWYFVIGSPTYLWPTFP